MPPSPGTTASGANPSRARRAFASLARAAVVVAAVIGGGAPAAVLVLFVHYLVDHFLPLSEMDPYYVSAVNASTVLIGLLLLLAICVLSPVAWRSTADPRGLRLIMYVSIQGVALGLGLISPDPVIIGEMVAWVLGGIGTVAWWAWQQRWRGSGIAPSVLTGVFKPPITPGQVWFAYVPGHVEDKVRPVMVLRRQEEANGWLCLYFTSRPPKSERLAASYLPAHVGSIRGLRVENWVQVSDSRTLGKRAFRSYTGLAPRWLYVEGCSRAGVVPDADAFLIDEQIAGSRPGPFESTLKRALLGRGEEHPAADQDPRLIGKILARIFRGPRPS